jgi:diguanylate cyclase (GGDEF)-like protein
MNETRARSSGDRNDPPNDDRAGRDRDRIAEDRDERAEAHDQESEARDERAAARDERAETRDSDTGGGDAGSVADRAGARRDRRGGASDRTQASDDRKAASDDREAASADRVRSAAEQAASSIDELTGAYRRDAGAVELEREIARAKRTKAPLAVAFVDVDGLKKKNDSEGHAAGDRLLCDTADSIRNHFRPYDLIIRYGGDEFVCALFDMDTEEAAERFSLVSADLRKQHASVSVGLASLAADDDLEGFLARADSAMYAERRRRLAGD